MAGDRGCDSAAERHSSMGRSVRRTEVSGSFSLLWFASADRPLGVRAAAPRLPGVAGHAMGVCGPVRDGFGSGTVPLAHTLGGLLFLPLFSASVFASALGSHLFLAFFIFSLKIYIFFFKSF